MKALCWYGKEDVRVEQVPDPRILNPRDAIVKITSTAICGSDLHLYGGLIPTLQAGDIIGHEFMGEVVAVGSHVNGFAVGDRVSGEGHITCGHCRNCRAGKRHLCRNTVGIGVNRDGAFADYLSLPASNAFKLPASLPNEIAAFLDPLGNAVHTALSFDLVGEDVLITGAGPIGIMAAAICKHVGARYVVVTDVNDFRLELARKCGADRIVNVLRDDVKDAMSDLGMTEGFDVALEMSGNASAFRTLLATMNHGGKVALLGIPKGEVAIDWNEVIFKGLVIKGVYGREMFDTWYKMVAMLQSGLDISPVLTHHVPASRFEEAFEAAASGQAGKVVMDWTG